MENLGGEASCNWIVDCWIVMELNHEASEDATERQVKLWVF